MSMCLLRRNIDETSAPARCHYADSASEADQQKKAQPCGVALKFHQRRRIWRSVPTLWESINTSSLCRRNSAGATLNCCYAVDFFCRIELEKLSRLSLPETQRTTNTGTLVWVSTLRVSLPSRT